MTFVVDTGDGDYAKTPRQLLLEQYLSVNPAYADTPDMIDFGPVLAGNATYEACVAVSEHKDDGVFGSDKFYYNRMPLSDIFSIVDISVNKVDFDVTNNLPVVNQRLYNEITRKYQLLVTAEYYNFTVTDGKLYMSAKATNYAYRGSVQIHPVYDTAITAAAAEVYAAAAVVISETVSVYPQ